MSYIKTTNPFLEIERGNIPSESHVYKLGTFPAKSDIGYMVKTSTGTANVSVAFDIFLKAV